MTWKTSSLGEICELINRGISPSYINEGGILVLNQKCIRNHQVNYELGRRHNSVLKPVNEKKLIRVGDVLVNSTGTGTLGRVALVREEPSEPTTVDSHVTIVRALNNQFNNLFFGWLLISIEEKIKEAGEGSVGQTELSRTTLRDKFIVSYPTNLLVQKRLAEKLESIFSEIERATIATENNAKNAEALFQSYLTEVFERGGEGWVELRLQDLLDKGWIISHLDGNHGGDYPRKEEFVSSGVPYISANCLNGDVLDLTKSKFLSTERASKLKKGLAKNDDVLFAHNATVGPVAILKTAEDITVLGTSLTYYRCNKEFIEPEYLANYMRSARFKNQYLTIMRQSTRNQIPITKQREFSHLIPPVETQRVLLQKFSVFLSMKTMYKSQALKKIKELSSLKQSILQQAFKGRTS